MVFEVLSKSLCGFRATNIDNRWLIYAAYALCCLAAVVIGLFAVMSYCSGCFDPLLVLCATPFVLVLTVLGIKLLLQNRGDVPFSFLVVATPVLLCFCFFLLPGYVPDEQWHIYRVLNFEANGDGNMVVPDLLKYGTLPLDYGSFYSLLTNKVDPSAVHIVDRDMSTYLSHLYVVPGIFALAAEWVGANPFAVVYVARCANVALFLVAGYWIIKLMPFGRTLVFVYLLNPMLLQQEASCSADAMVNIASLLFIAVVLSLRFKSNCVLRDWILLVAVSLLMVFSKFAYAPLLLLLLILVPKFENRRIRSGIYVGTGLVIVLIAIFVLFVYQGPSFKDAIDLLRQPGECASVLLKTYYEVGQFYIATFAGMSLGALNISVWQPCLLLYFGLLIAACYNTLGEKFSFSWRQRLLAVALFCLMTVLITLVLREWSVNVDHRSDIILGVQGRYFLPIAILPLLCFIDCKHVLVRKNCILVYACSLAVIYLFDFMAIIRFFW